MQQHRTFRAKAGHNGNVAKHVFAQQDFQHFDGVAPAKHMVQPDGVCFGIARAAIDTVGLSLPLPQAGGAAKGRGGHQRSER